MSSLRELRRKQTTESIRRAAVNLAIELGLDNVTTEMISNAAGISPRTFFNYFPYKEAAFLPPKMEFSSDSEEKFIRGTNALLDDMLTLLKAQLDEIVADRVFVMKTHEISVTNQKLQQLRASVFYEFEEKIGTIIAKRLEYTGESGDASHMAAIILASIRRGFEIWITSETESVFTCITARIKTLPTMFKT
ncbi:hypothetical protein A9Q96_13615 [Rhodobacterales bacterium 52_120_T64]|nr:hypothetical protein A9Q96_13615 [Rhodobacterales bacterium 52_120_T64]